MKFLIFFFSFISLIIHADEVYMLNSEHEAAQVRWEVISNAKSELYLSYYIFENDRIGIDALALIYDLAIKNPQLDIKLIFDAQNNKVDKRILYLLEQTGIELKEFHAIPKLFPGGKNINFKKFFKAIGHINRRMHDKLILADQEIMILGGRNLKKDYFGLSAKNFHDLDIYAKSKKAGNQARDYFLALWQSEHLQKFTYKKRHYRKKSQDSAKRVIEERLKIITKEMSQYKSEWKQHLYTVDNDSMNFLHSYDNETHTIRPEVLTYNLFNKFVQLSNKRIVLQTPYFLPTEEMYQAFKLLKEKNVSIIVITNSFCSSDVLPVVGAYDLRKKKMLEMGIKLFEYKGPDYLHTKAVLIDNIGDDDYSYVGTYNLDPRSAAINTEIMLELKGNLTSSLFKQRFLADIANTQQVLLDANGKVINSYHDCKKSTLKMPLYYMGKYLSIIPALYRLL